MKSNGSRYSPEFKFKAVVKALQAEGSRMEAQTLDEVDRVVDQQVVYVGEWRGDSGLDYLSAMWCLESEGIDLEPLAETASLAGSGPRAHARNDHFN